MGYLSGDRGQAGMQYNMPKIFHILVVIILKMTF